jgi:hypothetical protein
MNKIFVTILLLLASRLAPAATPVRVIFDLAHGPMSVPAQITEMGGRLGFEVRPQTEPLTAAALHGARLLYLRTPQKGYSPDEKAAAIDFVRTGGSLLVVFDEQMRTDLALTGINDVIEPFGMKLTADTEYLHNCGAIAKAGEINRDDRELPFSGGRAVEGGKAFGWQLDRQGKPAQPYASALQLENGARVVVLSEAMASAFLGKPEGVRLSGVPRDPTGTVYWGKDSALFMEEVFGWLLQR